MLTIIKSPFLQSKLTTLRDKKTSNWLFLIGLVLGPLFIMIISPSKIEFSVTNSLVLIPIAGFLISMALL